MKNFIKDNLSNYDFYVYDKLYELYLDCCNDDDNNSKYEIVTYEKYEKIIKAYLDSSVRIPMSIFQDSNLSDKLNYNFLISQLKKLKDTENTTIFSDNMSIIKE
jgi:hypothetical protein